MSPAPSHKVSRVSWYSGSCRARSPFMYGLSPSLGCFPKTILLGLLITYAVRTPGCTHPGLGSSAFARRYDRIDVSFSSSGYLDVSVHRVPFLTLCIGVKMTEVCSAGFPHSDISGSMDICSSPKLFAAYHVFHRLLVPRHPPYALSDNQLASSTGMDGYTYLSVICVGNSLLFLFVFSNQFSFPTFTSFHDHLGCLDIFLIISFLYAISRYTLDSFWNPMEITRFELVTSCSARQALSQLRLYPQNRFLFNLACSFQAMGLRSGLEPRPHAYQACALTG